jgi:hypothetical protein
LRLQKFDRDLEDALRSQSFTGPGLTLRAPSVISAANALKVRLLEHAAELYCLSDDETSELTQTAKEQSNQARWTHHCEIIRLLESRFSVVM